MRELYETTYTSVRHFSFGKNWQSFLETLTDQRLHRAEHSLIESFGHADALRGKTFLDVGSGSGLFSLAAYNLGAKSVTSLDVDEASLASTTSVRDQAGRPKRWRILGGSVLNERFLRTLGTFDVVYSWGVLHHTGNMATALTNVCRLVQPGGLLYVAIYNESRSLTHGTSPFWLGVKRFYNQSNATVKRVLESLYGVYLWLGLLASGKNPRRYIADYQAARGMSWRHDLVDWLGGYPYEYARPEEIINTLGAQGFACTKLIVRPTIGCNEYRCIRVTP